MRHSLLMVALSMAFQALYAQPAPKSVIEELEQSSAPLIQNFTNGNVNWTEQYIEAKGEAVIDTARFKNMAQSKAMAGRGAVVVAQRNLLEIIQGVQINSETTVRDFMTESDVIKTKVEGVLRGATVVEGPQEENGLMVVLMRVPLYEGNSLASAVYTGSGDAGNEATSTPPDTITTLAKTGGKQPSPAPSPATSVLPKEGEGDPISELILNLSQGKIDPSLFPEIKDLDGNTVLKLMEQYDPTSGKFPKMFDVSKKTLEKIRKDPAAMVIDIVKDKQGMLRIDAKNVERIEKWKNGARDVLGFVKSVLLF